MVLAAAETATRMGLADLVDVIDVVLTAAIGVVGLVALHSYGRQQRLKIADQRWGPYRTLWHITYHARSGAAVTPVAATLLRRKLLSWYYDDGNALVLPLPTQRMVRVILGDLLARADGRTTPPDPVPRLGDDITREVSILRTQLKIDLDVYRIDERGVLRRDDRTFEREFLARCGFDATWWGRPERWYRPNAFKWDLYHHGQLEDVTGAPGTAREP